MNRSKNDTDCILTDGNLNADTIFSLWLPFRHLLVMLNGYSKLNKYFFSDKKDIKKWIKFLKKIYNDEILSELIPESSKEYFLISKLFTLGRTGGNVMILPDGMRWLNFSGGNKPYYDYMPYFLYDLSSCKHAFRDEKELINWIEIQHLEEFFVGDIAVDNSKALTGSDNVCDTPTSANICETIRNYINILEKRVRLY